MTHTAAWVIHISDESRDEMDMQVEHGLPCRRAAIDANVITVWPMALINNCFCLGYQSQKGRLFLFSRLKPRRDMTSRNNERMSRGYRIAIPQRDCQLSLREYPVF